MSMTQLRDRRQAMALIIVVVTMVVLVVMGVSLVRIASYENAAVNNYVAYVDARLTAWAGIERTIAEIQSQLRTNGYVNWKGTLAYPATSDPDVLEASKNGENLSLHGAVLNGYSYSGQVGYRDSPTRILGRYDVGGNFYALKIEEQGGRLNVNSHISYTANDRKRSNTIMNTLLYTLATRCGMTSAQGRAAANALRPANNAVPFTYRYMDEIEDRLAGISEANDTERANKQKFLNNLSTDSWIDDTTSGTVKSGGVSSTPLYYREERAPVNINAVSRELLATLIEHIKATTILHNATGSGYGTDQVGTATFPTETTMGYVPTVIDIQFTSSIATNITDYLFNNYLAAGRITDRSHFEDIVDNYLPASQFPSNPYSTWLPDTTWKQLWRDALKSNFNPNVIDNYWNPNGWDRKAGDSIAGKRMYFYIAKGDLYNRTQADPPATPATPDSSTARSTELCFDSFGLVNVTCAAHVTANNGTLVAGQALMFTKLQFAERLTHTLQQDFGPATVSVPGNTDILSYPVVPTRTSQTGLTWDNVAGGIEPKPLAISGGLYTPDFTSSSVFPSAYQPKPFYSRMDARPLRSILLNNLTHDGIVSRLTHVNSALECPMFSTNANVQGADLRSYDGAPPPGSKVGNYFGTIEFWVKLADGPVGINTTPATNRGIAYGLFAFTTFSNNVLPPHSPIGQAASRIEVNPRQEGMQMYAYINTIGSLRISRLYYSVYWDETITTKAIKWRGAALPAFGDQDREVARRDIEVIDIGTTKDWRAHEWHHLRISWNDNVSYSNSESLEVWLDGTKVTSPIEYSSGEITGEFCVLNEKNPCDVFFLNGFFRDQAKRGGYFHFVADNSPVYYPGNVTIAGLRCFPYSRQGGGIAKYPVSADYTNNFTLPGGDTYELGPLCWEAYPRASATGARVICSTNGNDIDGPYLEPDFGDPGYRGEGLMPAGNRVRQGGEVVPYTASFTTDLSTLSGVYRIVCPALESVTLVVYYRYPKPTEIQFN